MAQLLVPRTESFGTFHPCPEISRSINDRHVSMQAIRSACSANIESRLLAILACNAIDRLSKAEKKSSLFQERIRRLEGETDE